MIVHATKYCDGCSEKVATKYCLLWHTDKNYVTIKGDDVTTYANYEDATTPYRLHYCIDCWKAIIKNIPFKSEVEPF